MTNREQAELVARFRTPPGMNWGPLADDIETLLDSKDFHNGQKITRWFGIKRKAACTLDAMARNDCEM